MATVNSDELLSAGLDLIDMGYNLTVSTGPKGNRPFLPEWQTHALPAEHIHKFIAFDSTTGIGAITAGLAVIDIDGAEGLANWKSFLQEHDLDPEPFREQMVSTPGGGYHIYLRDIDRSVTNAGGLLGPIHKIDVRGTGGFIAMPPTQRVGTDGYEWVRGPFPVDKLPDAPTWLSGRLSQTRTGEWTVSNPATDWQEARTPWGGRQVQRIAQRIADTDSGGRHQALIVGSVAVGHLIVEGNMTVEFAYESLDEAAYESGLHLEGRSTEVKRTILDGFMAAFSARSTGLEKLMRRVEEAR